MARKALCVSLVSVCFLSSLWAQSAPTLDVRKAMISDYRHRKKTSTFFATKKKKAELNSMSKSEISDTSKVKWKLKEQA